MSIPFNFKAEELGYRSLGNVADYLRTVLKPFGVFKTAFEINPTTRQEPEDLAKEFVAQSKDLVARMNKLMGK